MKKLVIGCVLFMSFNVLADQCYVISENEAKSAEKIVQNSDAIMKYCEPCGGSKTFHSVKEVSYDAWEDTYNLADPSSKVLSINEKPVDIAYIFVKTGEKTYTNLSKLVGCDSRSVSSFINLD